MRSRFIFLVLILAAATVVAACTPTKRGVSRPPSSAQTVSGEPLALSLAAPERPTLVVFWASWCVPCRAEAPDLVALHRHFQGSIDFLGVSVDENAADALAFATQFDLPYASAHDPELAISDALGVESVPMLVLLGAGGTELARGSALSDVEPAMVCVAEGRPCE